jgi:hypothetical protein
MSKAAGALPVYTFRSNLFRSERRFTLTSEGLLVESRRRRALILYRDIASVQLHQVDIRATGPVDRCGLRAHGRTIRLQSAHVAGPANLQDRRTSYEPFVWRLILRIISANPDVRVMVGTPWPSRLGWAFTLVLLVAGGLGGLALLFSGDWGGLWLIAAALASSPMVIAMLNRRPSRRMDTAMLAASSGYRNLLAS